MVKGVGFRWDWSHIKLRCEHIETLFVLKILEKYDAQEEERRRYVKRKQDEDSNDDPLSLQTPLETSCEGESSHSRFGSEKRGGEFLWEEERGN